MASCSGARWPTATSPGDYPLTGYFPRAGQGLQPGSEVAFRGVQVGAGLDRSRSPGGRAKVTVLIDPGSRVPGRRHGHDRAGQPLRRRAGDALTTPGRRRPPAPTCPRGGTFARAASSDELGDLFAAATPLLNPVNTTTFGRRRRPGPGHRRGGPPDRPRHRRRRPAGGLLGPDARRPSWRRSTPSPASPPAVAPDGPAVNGLSAAGERGPAGVQPRTPPTTARCWTT